MSHREFRFRTVVDAGVVQVFDLSRSIDLHVDSMQRSKERAVAGVTSGLIGPDQSVTWEARHFGRTWRVTSRISEFDPPRRFVDEMSEGPFAYYRHEHLFEEKDGRTVMDDVVRFRTRFGPLADRMAEVYLRRLMKVRNEHIRKAASPP
ncbi:MAG: SRPBCC family protein [Actinomycetota bacterium]